MKRYSTILALLATAFLGRVLGQFLVACSEVRGLPPMQEWYSGLIPYPILFSIQLAILALQFEISRQLWVGCGRFTEKHERLGNSLKWFSLVYFLVMVIRYVVTMWYFPERRWFGGTIPIFFHWVLAAYIYLFSRHQRGIALPQTSHVKNIE